MQIWKIVVVTLEYYLLLLLNGPFSGHFLNLFAKKRLQAAGPSFPQLSSDTGSPYSQGCSAHSGFRQTSLAAALRRCHQALETWLQCYRDKAQLAPFPPRVRVGKAFRAASSLLGYQLFLP